LAFSSPLRPSSWEAILSVSTDMNYFSTVLEDSNLRS